jgi:hypothetical protein
MNCGDIKLLILCFKNEFLNEIIVDEEEDKKETFII